MTDPAAQPGPPYARPPYPAQPYPAPPYPAPPYPVQPYSGTAAVRRAGRATADGPVPFPRCLLSARTARSASSRSSPESSRSSGASIAVSIAAYQIGLGAGRQLAARALTADFDWSILSPVRDWVLLGEISFWVGTVFGLWALAQGIVAIVTGRGRGAGIAAAALAVAGPIAFFVALNVFLGLGLAAGFPAAAEDGTLLAGGVVLLLG